MKRKLKSLENVMANSNGKKMKNAIQVDFDKEQKGDDLKVQIIQKNPGHGVTFRFSNVEFEEAE